MKAILLILIILLNYPSYAQSLTGSWYGKANVSLHGNHNNYLTELVIKQKAMRLKAFLDIIFATATKAFLSVENITRKPGSWMC